MRQVGPLIPPAAGHRGDPAPRNAELTVYSLGPDEDAILPALQLLGEFGRRELRRFTGSLPCTLVLPRAYYDRSDTFVALLRSTGTRFAIRSWAWMCPDEAADERTGRTQGLHWCTGACPVAQFEEITAS